MKFKSRTYLLICLAFTFDHQLATTRKIDHTSYLRAYTVKRLISVQQTYLTFSETLSLLVCN